MPEPKNAQISSRKHPKQARSADLVTAVLAAAAQVLAKEGAHRFTTARVAEKAGVSVGSLYQYFPNKAAILFRLQTDEWRQTTALLREILEDDRQPPLDRLRQLVHAFIRSECEEAAVRVALDDAAPLYRDAPEAQEAKASGDRIVHHFMREALPQAADTTVAIASDLITTTLSMVGKRFSETPRTPSEIEAYAEALADMFCAYLGALEVSEPPCGGERHCSERERQHVTSRQHRPVSGLEGRDPDQPISGAAAAAPRALRSRRTGGARAD